MHAPPRPIPIRAVIRRCALALAAVSALTLASGCADDPAAALPPLLRALSEHAGVRSTSGRLSITAEHRPCRESDRGYGDAIPRCDLEPSPPTPQLLQLAEEISARVDRHSDPEALHAAGLIQLSWAGDDTESIDQAIAYLAAAARLSPRPGSVLADLSAAHLARAELRESTRDLLEAIEAASRSVEEDEQDLAARFNLALALDRFGLTEQAAREWEHYRSVDPATSWTDEVVARLDARPAVIPTPSSPTVHDSPSDARAFAVGAPLRARLLGWDEVLGAWGAAVLVGDSLGAERSLSLAEALGGGLIAADGDGSLAAAVETIRASATDPDAIHRLARAHRAYAAGRAAYLATRLDLARDSFSSGLAADPPSATLRSWLEAYHTATAPPDGQARPVHTLVTETDSVRFPALAGQARWLAAMLLVRSGAYEQSLAMAGRAVELFDGIGETESVAGLLSITADIQFGAGARDAGYRTTRRALRALGEIGPTVWTHNVLFAAAQAAASEGLTHAALHIQHQDVAVGRALRAPLHQADALLGRARISMLAHDTAAAARDLRSATEIVVAFEPGQMRDWLATERRLTVASLARRREPQRALAALDSILSVAGGVRTQVHLIQAHVSRAQAFVAMANTARAIADLDSATAVLDRQRTAIRGTSLHISLLESARTSFDQLVMLALAEGDEDSALRFLERGRAYFSPRRRTGPRTPFIPSDGVTALSYALIGDTLLTGVLRDGDIRVVRASIDRSDLILTIDRARSALELGRAGSAVEADLARLYDLLIRPVESELSSGIEPLLVVADGEIAGTPFPALRDRTSGRYLIERFPLRFAASLGDAGTRPTHAAPAAALFISDPGRTAGRNASLPALPQARREVETIARWYPRAEILTGDAVTPEALRSLSRSHDVLHFAGHAVFDDRAPEQSYLVLDPLALDAGGGRLTAAELEQMDLSSYRLVVLSACETMRAHDGRSGGFDGFSAALLRAGAGGVVGSTWRVEDEATLRLMTAFHRAFLDAGDAATALRTAQIALLRSDDPTLATPAAWAGFRYAGQ